MSVALRVLILETSNSVGDTLRDALTHTGFTPEGPVVRDAMDFRAHFESGLDLILAEHAPPDFGALQALELLQESGWDIPLIAVAAAFSEDSLAQLIDAGAAHCIRLDQLKPLGPAVCRALERRKLHRETRSALEALGKSESQYRTLVENARDVVFHLNSQGEFTLLNRAFQDITGWDREAWVGRPFAPIIHESDRERAIDIFRRTLAGERVDLFELQVIHRDGSVAVGQFTITRQHGAYGDMSVLGIARDVTHRYHTAEALKRSEERLRHIIENTSDCFWEVDENGVYTYVSPTMKSLLGYEPDELIGKQPVDLMPEDEGKRILAYFNEISRDRKPFSLLENANLHKDGHRVVLESSGVPVFDSNGAFRGYRGVDRDITERKRLESQLRQSHKMESLGSLAGGIAHDFNNLIGIISGYCEITMESLEPDHPVRSYLEQIDAAGQRASNLVQQILTFARKTQVSPESINLNDAVPDIVNMLRETFPKTIEISHDLEPDLPNILADASQINQVLMNLCVNARDAMPDGGKLVIGTRVAGPEEISDTTEAPVPEHFVCISVNDTGTGMTDEVRQSIFDPFFTTKNTALRSGLGLSVVHGIVQGHRGHIEVKSEPGRGTTFQVYFAPDQQTPRRTEPKPASPPTRRGTETVLLVEDEPAILEMTQTALRNQGYHVLTATDGHQALASYREHRSEIAAVLLDLGLPKLDGISVLEQIRETDSDTNVIVASGFLEPDQKRRLEHVGRTTFVPKPYELKTLVRAVEEAVTRTC